MRPSFEDFHRHYEPFVRAYLRRRASADGVDGLVSEVFAIAWRRFDSVPADGLPWLYRTARNVVGNRYRTDARLAALNTKLRSVPTEDLTDPADVVGERELLLAALGSLSDDDRELLLLVAWEGLTTAEVAQVLELSQGAVAVRLHRARRRLEQAHDGGDSVPARHEQNDHC